MSLPEIPAHRLSADRALAHFVGDRDDEYRLGCVVPRTGYLKYSEESDGAPVLAREDSCVYKIVAQRAPRLFNGLKESLPPFRILTGP